MGANTLTGSMKTGGDRRAEIVEAFLGSVEDRRRFGTP